MCLRENSRRAFCRKFNERRQTVAKIDSNVGDADFYDAEAGLWAQKALCERKSYPMFVPEGGQCPACGRMIFLQGGYSLKDAGNMLITRCPFCSYSFCE